jgi:hypothetical protein
MCIPRCPFWSPVTTRGSMYGNEYSTPSHPRGINEVVVVSVCLVSSSCHIGSLCTQQPALYMAAGDRFHLAAQRGDYHRRTPFRVSMYSCVESASDNLGVGTSATCQLSYFGICPLLAILDTSSIAESWQVPKDGS